MSKPDFFTNPFDYFKCQFEYQAKHRETGYTCTCAIYTWYESNINPSP